MIYNYMKFLESLSETKDLFPESWKNKLNITDNQITLHHFGPSGLKELDPEQWGEHSYTDSENWWGKKRIYFYTQVQDQEKMISGEHYQIKYPLDKLYPFNADPLYFYEECQKDLDLKSIPVRRQVICIADKAQRAGYDGMIYRWRDTFLAVIWVPVTVENTNTEES